VGQLMKNWEVKVLDDLDPDLLLLVCDFFNKEFPEVYYPECTPEIFEWKLSKRNPAGTGFLTVAISNGLIVGTASGTRKIISEGGKSFEAIEIGDTFTHPDFRKSGSCITPFGTNTPLDPYFSLSIFGRLVSETIERAQLNGVRFIYGTPNTNSQPPYLKRLHFKEVNKGQVSSNLIITHNFYKLRRFPRVAKFFMSIFRLVNYSLRYLIMGRNSVLEITKEDFIMNLSEINFPAVSETDKLSLVRSPEILEHRYLAHPSYNYRFFKLLVNDQNQGVLITTEILRTNGIRSFVVSDWLISDRKIEKRLPLLLPLLLPHIRDSEIISFWEFEGYSKLKKLVVGTLKYSTVSLISKDNRLKKTAQISEFESFRMGWSDNG
jgi:hypothetical protein